MKTIMLDLENQTLVVVPDIEFYEGLEFYDDERGCWFGPYADLEYDCD